MSAKIDDEIPKWLHHLMVPGTLVNEYKNREMYTNNRITRFLKPRSQSKTRTEQLKLMEDTLLAITQNTELMPKQKVTIVTGLMLVIKHKIDKEEGQFKSRLGSVVNTYLNLSDGIPPETTENAIKVFKKFSESAYLALDVFDKMKTDINDAVNDTRWQKKQFYGLHKEIDTINKAISTIIVISDKPNEKLQTSSRFGLLSKMYAELSQSPVLARELPLTAVDAKQKYVVNKYNCSFEELVAKTVNDLNQIVEFMNGDLSKQDGCLTASQLKQIQMALEACDNLIKIGELLFSTSTFLPLPITKAIEGGELLPSRQNTRVKQLQDFLNTLNAPLQELRDAAVLAQTPVTEPNASPAVHPSEPPPPKGIGFSLHLAKSNSKKADETSNLFAPIHASMKTIEADIEPMFNQMMQASHQATKNLVQVMSQKQDSLVGRHISAKDLISRIDKSFKDIGDALAQLEGGVGAPVFHWGSILTNLRILQNCATKAEAKLKASPMSRDGINNKEQREILKIQFSDDKFKALKDRLEDQKKQQNAPMLHK